MYCLSMGRKNGTGKESELSHFLVALIHHGYAPKQIADYLQIHYSTVSKVIATVALNET
jgi:DNA-binding CsgD family transcriptional regulator